MRVQSIDKRSNYKINFEGKLNVRNKYMFDTDLIKNFVSSEEGVLLNLKERIFHSIPTEGQLGEFHYKCQEIIKNNSVTHMPKKYNSAGMPEGWNNYDHISEHSVVSTPERARALVELFEDSFWSKFGVKQLKINIPYDSFVKIYKEAIKPENAAKIFDLM